MLRSTESSFILLLNPHPHPWSLPGLHSWFSASTGSCLQITSSLGSGLRGGPLLLASVSPVYSVEVKSNRSRSRAHSPPAGGQSTPDCGPEPSRDNSGCTQRPPQHPPPFPLGTNSINDDSGEGIQKAEDVNSTKPKWGRGAGPQLQLPQQPAGAWGGEAHLRRNTPPYPPSLVTLFKAPRKSYVRRKQSSQAGKEHSVPPGC